MDYLVAGCERGKGRAGERKGNEYGRNIDRPVFSIMVGSGENSAFYIEFLYFPQTLNVFGPRMRFANAYFLANA